MTTAEGEKLFVEQPKVKTVDMEEIMRLNMERRRLIEESKKKKT